VSEQISSTLHILDGGFRPRPEQLAEYGKHHEEFLPVATAQPGFRETYGGPIPNSPWWFFTAKFDSLEDMERWQMHRAHTKVQDLAREVWWTAYYIRKGRVLAPQEVVSGKVLGETAILRDTLLAPEDSGRMESALALLPEFSIVPYETLSGESIPTPYLLTQSLGTIPHAAPVHYALLTYWHRTTDCQQWQGSVAYQQLANFGVVRSARFVIIPERSSRMGLRSDRTQREWSARG
jgi:hypothetical protein